MTSFGILGTGKSLPENILTNDDLIAKGVDTTDEWIQTRTGIQSRHIADEHTHTSDLAYRAAKDAITSSNIKKEEIDLIIVGTSTPDFKGFPSVACLVQHKLGLKNCPAFDVSAACTGFNYALTTALNYCKSGMAKHALVIGADCLSKITNWSDRSTCILFGDGAGAIILGPVSKNKGIIASSLYSNGKLANILKVEKDGIYMEGKSVFKTAIQYFVPAVEKALESVSLSKEQLDILIPHQANLRIIDQTRKKLGLNKNQVLINIQKYGNTSAASIPIALAEAHENNLLCDNHILALVGFGAGFTWGVNLLKWGH